MLKEFKTVLMQGNVIDLAVGVIIGGGFGKIVNSLVNDIVMPLVGIILGGVDFKGLSIKVGTAVVAYGNFIQVTAEFLIIAFCIYIALKALQKAGARESGEMKK